MQPIIAKRLIERMDAEELAQLTKRELEVLRLLAGGVRSKEIADRLFLSVRTVRFHLSNIFRKLDVETRTEAVRIATDRTLLNS